MIVLCLFSLNYYDCVKAQFFKNLFLEKIFPFVRAEVLCDFMSKRCLSAKADD